MTAEATEMAYSAQPDLRDMPLQNLDGTLFSNDSSMIINGVQRAIATVLMLKWTVQSEAFPPETPAQRNELIALTWASELGKDKQVNIYPNSHYVFVTLHVQGAIYRERGLPLTGGKILKFSRKY